VNAQGAAALEQALAAQPGRASSPYLIGRDLALNVPHTLTDASTVGHDRLLCALGAYHQSQQACVVIDAGTAVTVDFVDGQGTFHGGVIAPGAAMMLKALHEGTSALPLVDFGPVRDRSQPFGKATPDAMLRGVHAAIVGMVHLLIDRYAEYYDAYPQIVATGGDAPCLFEGDELVEHIVPDLQLVGIRAACARALDADDD
jgi:type III pantothenate kinase